MSATRCLLMDFLIGILLACDAFSFAAPPDEDDEEFRPGERVRLVTGGGKTRVTH